MLVGNKMERGQFCMGVDKATEQEIQAFAEELGTWTLQEDKLHREYKFQNFV